MSSIIAIMGVLQDDYIRDLCQRYDGDVAALIPVPTPTWSVEGAGRS